MCEKFAVCINKTVIDSPAIDTDTRDPSPEIRGSCSGMTQAGLYFVKDQLKIPSKKPTIEIRRIMKPVNLFEQELFSIERSQENAPASCSEINGNVEWTVHRLLSKR